MHRLSFVSFASFTFLYSNPMGGSVITTVLQMRTELRFREAEWPAWGCIAPEWQAGCEGGWAGPIVRAADHCCPRPLRSFMCVILELAFLHTTVCYFPTLTQSSCRIFYLHVSSLMSFRAVSFFFFLSWIVKATLRTKESSKVIFIHCRNLANQGE